MDYGIAQGLERATGNLAATGMKLMEFQANQRHQQTLETTQQAYLSMAKDRAKIENAQHNLELENLQKQKEAYERPMDIKTNPAFLSLPDAIKPEALKYFATNKFTDENGIGKTGDIIQGVKTIEASKQLFQTFLGPVVQQKQAGVMQAWNELSEARATADPKKIQVAQAKFDQLNGDYHQSLGKFDEHLKSLTEQENKEKIEQMKIDASVKKVDESNKTDYQLTRGALRETLKREPTDLEVKSQMQKDKLELAAKNRAIIGNPAGGNSFPNWEKPDQEMAYQTKMLTGKGPVFGSRDSESKAAFEKGYNQFIRRNGFRASDIALMQADYRAGNMSLGNMSKQEAPMNAFVLNINKQVNKLEELYKKADRTGLRIFDLPIRELKMRAKGSGEEAVIASYLLEVSNEIGKLASGASASVQQLSDSAKEDWKKVHDPNLSMKEIMYVLSATKDQANMRITTWREAKEAVRSNLRSLGIPDQPEATNVIRYDAKGNRL